MGTELHNNIMMIRYFVAGQNGRRRRSSAGGGAEAAALLDEANAWVASQTAAPGAGVISTPYSYSKLTGSQQRCSCAVPSLKP